MSDDTFTSGKETHKITIYSAPADGKKHPMLLLVHGNFGLGSLNGVNYGDQIRSFAKNLAGLGYVTAVPQYYADDEPHIEDRNPDPHVPTLSAAVAKVASRSDADPDRLGLIGFSLGGCNCDDVHCFNSPGSGQSAG